MEMILFIATCLIFILGCVLSHIRLKNELINENCESILIVIDGVKQIHNNLSESMKVELLDGTKHLFLACGGYPMIKSTVYVLVGGVKYDCEVVGVKQDDNVYTQQIKVIK